MNRMGGRYYTVVGLTGDRMPPLVTARGVRKAVFRNRLCFQGHSSNKHSQPWIVNFPHLVAILEMHLSTLNYFR